MLQEREIADNLMCHPGYLNPEREKEEHTHTEPKNTHKLKK